MANNQQDEEQLKKLCEQLNEITKNQSITLKVIEIKGTIYFFPQLEPEPARDCIDDELTA
ncbi:MAG: hypothetical protein PHI97_19755 [Desulfobulbus sp.]|jgi:hypothetical protein|nr:hypothetical protein [Desulfobulbus sp.]